MDQLDERDRQAFMELQDKLIEQTNKKKQVLARVHNDVKTQLWKQLMIAVQVAAQLRTRDKEQKMALLTAEELNTLPDDAKTYEQIGRA